jgi:hypothetical protein
VACAECGKLRSECDTALARLKVSIQALEHQNDPTSAELAQIEKNLLAYTKTRTALEKHIESTGHSPTIYTN